MVKRAVAILLFVLVVAGLLFWSQFRHEPLKVSGFIEADEIRLGSRVGGRVLRVLAQEGDRVHQGEVLVELEPYDLLEQQTSAAAELAAAQAEYDRLIAGFRPEEIAQAKARVLQLTARQQELIAGPRKQEIAAAAAQLEVALAQQVLADQQFRRTFDLRQKGAATQEELDRATEQRRAATSTVAVREEELALLREGTRQEELEQAKAELEQAREAHQLQVNGYRPEDVAQAQARRDAAAANLAALAQQVKELKIVSPIENAVVESHELQPGDLVAAGAPVMSIIDVEHLWVRAFVPENHLGLQINDRLEMTVDGFPNQKFYGTITYISRQAEFTPSNVQTPEDRAKLVFRIKVTLPVGQPQLRPGMLADVWLESAGESP